MDILLVAILGALIPTCAYTLFVWWLDRYEKEPLRLLALSFFWGAVPAALLSVLLELLFDVPIYVLGGEGIVSNLISYSFSAPVIEESAKAIALVSLWWLARREFDDVLDGIIYGAMIGLGFAFSENLFAYFLPILSQEGWGAGVINILLRAVIFGLNHALWTGTIGAALGYARLAHAQEERMIVPVAGWALAILLHGAHNAGATLAEYTSGLSLGFSLVLDWGGVFVLLAVAYLALRRESRWIERGLAEEVRRGDLTVQEFQLLRSVGKRLQTQWRARRRGGRPAHRALGRYYQCATELAFKKQHLRSLGDEGGNLNEVQRLREQLATHRALVWPWLWTSES